MPVRRPQSDMETLEGSSNTTVQLLDHEGQPLGPYAGLGLPPAIAAYDNAYPLELTSQGSAEAQAAALRR